MTLKNIRKYTNNYRITIYFYSFPLISSKKRICKSIHIRTTHRDRRKVSIYPDFYFGVHISSHCTQTEVTFLRPDQALPGFHCGSADDTYLGILGQECLGSSDFEIDYHLLPGITAFYRFDDTVTEAFMFDTLS